MRAVVLNRPGGPEALQFQEIERPRPGPQDALVRVRAAGINRLDVWIRNGAYRATLPHVPGADVAGELLEGSPSGRFPSGSRVVVFPVLSCGKCVACRRGRESLCPTVGILGRERWGGYAEELTVPESQLFPLPGGVDWEKAGALPIAYLSAEHALGRAKVRPGETVVVFGASGGLGCALIARAVRRQARVLAVTGSPQNVPSLRALGAEEVLPRGAGDLPDRIAALTGGRGADVAIDSVGKAVLPSGVRSVARGGRYVLVGVTSGAEAELDLRSVYTRQISLLGSFLGDRGEFTEIVQDLARSRLDPLLDLVLPLERAPEAHRRLELPHLGKFVLVPPGPT